MRLNDGWGVYDGLDCDAKLSHADIARVREYHVVRNAMDKRHKGVRRDTIERFMNLGCVL